MIRIPTHGAPTHPGEMLAEEFLAPLGMSQSELAERIGVPFQRVNRIVNRRQSVTLDTALRLGRLFGTTPDFWLNLQRAWDMYELERSREAEEIHRIKPLRRRSGQVA